MPRCGRHAPSGLGPSPGRSAQAASCGVPRALRTGGPDVDGISNRPPRQDGGDSFRRKAEGCPEAAPTSASGGSGAVSSLQPVTPRCLGLAGTRAHTPRGHPATRARVSLCPPSPAVLHAGEAAGLPLTLQVTLHSPDFVRIAVCPLSLRMALRHACAASRALVVRSLLAALPSARTERAKERRTRARGLPRVTYQFLAAAVTREHDPAGVEQTAQTRSVVVPGARCAAALRGPTPRCAPLPPPGSPGLALSALAPAAAVPSPRGPGAWGSSALPA